MNCGKQTATIDSYLQVKLFSANGFSWRVFIDHDRAIMESCDGIHNTLCWNSCSVVYQLHVYWLLASLSENIVFITKCLKHEEKKNRCVLGA